MGSLITVEELIDAVIDTDWTSFFDIVDEEDDEDLRLNVGKTSLFIFDSFGLVTGDNDILDKLKFGFFNSSLRVSI